MPHPQKQVVSIVVPILNEEKNIEPLYGRIKEVFSRLAFDFELIFIDDGSSDRSLEIVDRLNKEDSRLKYLLLSPRVGHQMALTAGLDFAEGEAVVLMDADLQHPPEIIPKLIDKWKEGYSNVYTVRKSKSPFSFGQKFSSVIFYHLFRRLTQLDIPLYSADFRLLDRRLVLQFRRIRERNRFLRGLIYWTGYSSAGVEYDEPPRQSGEGKYNFRKRFLLAMDAIVSFSNLPLYLGVLVGVISAFLGFIYLAYVLYIHFFTHTDVPGWASVVCLLGILGGIQLIVVGLMGVYIGKIFEEVKQRPRYFLQRSRGIDLSKIPFSNRES